MDDFVIYLRAWLWLAVAGFLVAAAWCAERRRDPGDTRVWKPAEAVVVGRSTVYRDRREYARLTVGFRTWRGHLALLVADVPAGQAPPTDRVWVVYDPLHPERAQLATGQPDDV